MILCSLTGCFNPHPDMFADTEGMGSSAGESGTTGPGPASGSSGTTGPASASGSSGGDAGCQSSAGCDDHNDCTEDTCDMGQCAHDPISGPGCSCSTPDDCTNLPPNDDCQTRTCDNGQCGQAFADPGTPVGDAAQTAEDCQQVVCDGAGGQHSVPDDSDVPVDGLECTDDVCTDGVPSNPARAEGTPCAAGSCNADGACEGCTTPSDCGGTDTFCEQVTCTVGVCGVTETAAGTPLPGADQTTGDCQQLQCDGNGNAAPVTDGTDVPADDGNQCTDDVCQGSTAAHPDVTAGSPCTASGGTVCDGMGACVACNENSECPGSGACLVGACVNHQCTTAPASSLTSCNDGLFCTAVDHCDGNGSCVGSGDPCGACQTCSSGACHSDCVSGEHCCPGTTFDICLDDGVSCP